ncbi:MAG: DUF5995 family protein [Ginsengibacter sp.]
MNTAPIITKSDLLLLQPPVTVEEVIAQLEKIITWCEINNNCAGYFAILYHKVTCKVKDCVIAGDFKDGVRMKHLLVVFASRYLDAFYLWIDSKPTTNSWKVTFDAVPKKTLLVLQHMLLAMNAHINLDLSIATTGVMRGFLLEDIHDDFNSINNVLASMVDNMEGCLTKVNPLMKLLNLNIYKYDEMLVQFSISTARDGAWAFAQALGPKTGTDYDNCIHVRDESIARLANTIAMPQGFLLKLIVKLIRLFEKKDVAGVMKLLET